MAYEIKMVDYEKWYKKNIEKSNESEQHLLNLSTLELILMIQELKDENEKLKDFITGNEYDLTPEFRKDFPNGI